MLLLAASDLRGANPGDEVIVIYNTRVPESKGVADYYAARRHVPTNQIFGFALTGEDDMSRTEFRDALQKPLARQLESKGLWHISSQIVRDTNGKPAQVEHRVSDSKIRYAVICYGVPFRIREDPSLKEPAAETVRPELRRNGAAVDSELALLPIIEENPLLAGPLSNPLYASTNEAAFNPTSGVLMVARLDGPGAAIARSLVDKALEAETNGLWGRAYFDVRNTTDPGYKPGDVWIRNAGEICRHLGFETVVDESTMTFPAEFPMSQIAFYCGWYDNDVSGPFKRPNVEFMPGAFAYHLHSYSAANLRSTTNNWVGPLLAKGATISMGCVDEPFLSGTPEVAVFAARLIFFGYSFGEAAYASQAVLSWQTTVVGDPLYRPFGKPAQQLHDELAARNSPLIEWSYLRLIDMNLAKGIPAGELVNYLERLDLTKRSAVLAEKLADLYAAQGKPSSAAEWSDRALKLDPSPLQRVRLRLVLAERLTALNRDADALDDLDKLLREDPDYPARLELNRRLLGLAQKLGKKDLAATYEERIRQLSPPPQK